jgi:hypothetical protein
LINPIEAQRTFNFFPTELVSPAGNSVLFMIKGKPFPEPLGSNGTSDVYEAQRTAGGWRLARLLTPNGEQSPLPNAGGVSSDHGYTFIQATEQRPGEYSGTLGEGGDASYLGKPDGSFELLGTGSMGVEPVSQGRFISSEGSHIIFTTGPSEWCSTAACPANQLEPMAPPSGTATVYDRSVGGPTRVVSLLPGNVTPAAGENAEYQGASADGSMVAFKVGGVLYVRVNNTETKRVTGEPSIFGGIFGGRVFFVSEGNIRDFIVGSEEEVAVTLSGDAEIVNISADGTHVYFISHTALPGSAAEPGAPNLYLWTEGNRATHFIGTVSPLDLEGKPALNTWTSDVVTPEKSIGQGPGADPSRTTPDGEVMVFESRAQLTPYDNEGFVEIYRYDAASQNLACISCNPLGGPPVGNARLEAQEFLFPQGGESMVVHNLTTDGSRVFFETSEALVGRDVDGVNDIYEWQDGVLSLISSGRSVFYSNPGVPLQFQEPNVMVAVTPTGSDVVFRTNDQLLFAGPGSGSAALYDARIDGGFVEPTQSPCESQICGGAVAAPALAAPGSNAFRGRGNVKPQLCLKSHHNKKVKKHGNKGKKHAKKGKKPTCGHRRGHKKGAGK